MQFPEAVGAVEVPDASGKPLVSDVAARDDATHTLTLRVVAENVPAVGYEVVRVVPAGGAASAQSTLKADSGSIENEFLRVQVDGRLGASPACSTRRPPARPWPPAFAATFCRLSMTGLRSTTRGISTPILRTRSGI